MKSRSENVVIQLSNVNKISIKTEGNWAIRKDTLILSMTDSVVELFVSSFDVEKLKSVIKDVCFDLQISNDIN